MVLTNIFFLVQKLYEDIESAFSKWQNWCSPYDDKDVESHVDGRIGLIDWQIAEELIISGETENAIQYYAEILKEKNLKTWNTLEAIGSRKNA